jgi:hypothetical protein
LSWASTFCREVLGVSLKKARGHCQPPLWRGPQSSRWR